MLSTYWHCFSFYIQQSKLFAFGVRYRERNLLFKRGHLRCSFVSYVHINIQYTTYDSSR